MKYPRHTTQILHEIAKHKLTGHEFRVFVDWLADAKGFNPTAKVMADRMQTGRTQVTKSLVKLREKEIIEVKYTVEITETGKTTNAYDLTETFKMAAGVPIFKSEDEFEPEDIFTQEELEKMGAKPKPQEQDVDYGYIDHLENESKLDQ